VAMVLLFAFGFFYAVSIACVMFAAARHHDRGDNCEWSSRRKEALTSCRQPRELRASLRRLLLG
jgi:hypothetical protein